MHFFPTVQPVLPQQLTKEIDEEQLLKQMEEQAEARVRWVPSQSVVAVCTPGTTAVRDTKL